MNMHSQKILWQFESSHAESLSSVSEDPSPFDVAKHLGMTQKPSKVNVEHVSSCFEHDIVIVPVTNSQNISGYTAPSTGVNEILHCLKDEDVFRIAMKRISGES